MEEDPNTRELYLICEYANGGSLADYLDRHGPLPEAQALQIAVDICAALEETERRKIVHRDVKPSNILLNIDERGQISAKLSDFGVAQDHRMRRTT
ncbi:MAG: protein kinase, partial [Blastochloris sp.]|nr:protein kinase [Blastochloris sp.]